MIKRWSSDLGNDIKNKKINIVDNSSLIHRINMHTLCKRQLIFWAPIAYNGSGSYFTTLKEVIFPHSS